MQRALIVVDYTFDFVADEGKLTCGKPGQAIDNYITRLSQSFLEAGDLVVVAVDVHDEGDLFHPETRLFPPHNLRGTAGRELYGQLGVFVRKLSQTGIPDNFLWMDKTRYSAFAGTPLELALRSRDIADIHLVGVCTDICVLHTAVDAYNKGFKITVHKDGVASFNSQGHEWALQHFASVLGAAVI